MSIEIKRFKWGEDKKLCKAFLMLPKKLYKDDKYWVPEWLAERKMLHNPKQNPCLKRIHPTYFVAFKDDEPVGRVTAHIIEEHNSFHEEKTGFFGFFECINEQEVANKMLHAAEQEMRNAGMTEIRGPSSFTSNEEYGMLVDGLWEDSPQIMMIHNPKYYIDLVKNAGYKKAMDLLAYRIGPEDWPNAKIQRVSKLIRKRKNITIREIDLSKKGFPAEREKLIEVYNHAWEKNWGFVPLNREEFEHAANSLRSIMNPKFSFLAEVGGETVAFNATLPDIHQILKHSRGKTLPMLWHLFIRRTHRRKNKIINRVRVALLGVKSKYRRKGLEAIIFEEIFLRGIEYGFDEGEMSWILETNVEMNNSADMLGAKIYKTYRIWHKPL
ncbi:MAG: N-acetyltransferase [Planctomycetes bacterium]|nr:N-acetyltransferase [Planctomycetota bacterium]